MHVIYMLLELLTCDMIYFIIQQISIRADLFLKKYIDLSAKYFFLHHILKLSAPLLLCIPIVLCNKFQGKNDRKHVSEPSLGPLEVVWHFMGK